MRTVILVTGPPCAGKTSYVAARAKPGDLVLDQDVIGAKAMRTGLAKVARLRDGMAWVIRCCPGAQRRNALAAQIQATEVVHLQPTEAELISRASRRPHPRRHIQAIRDWLRREDRNEPPPRKRSPANTQHRMVVASQPRWAGRKGRPWRRLCEQVYATETHCIRCGRYVDQTLPPRTPMSRSVDHKVALYLGGAPLDRRNVGLAHYGCNGRHGAQMRWSKSKRTPKPTLLTSEDW